MIFFIVMLVRNVTIFFIFRAERDLKHTSGSVGLRIACEAISTFSVRT